MSPICLLLIFDFCKVCRDFLSLCKIHGSGYFSAMLVHHEVHGLEKLLGLLSGLGEFMCVRALEQRTRKKKGGTHFTEQRMTINPDPSVKLPQSPVSMVMVSVGGPILQQ